MHKMFKRIGQFTQLCVSISTKKFQPHVNYKLCRAIPQPAFKCYSTSEGNTNANVQNIDPDVKKELNQLKLELSLMYQDGYRVVDPEKVTWEQWQYLLTLKTRKARLEEYTYLGKRVLWKSSFQNKRARLRETFQMHVKDQQERKIQEKHIIYGLGNTSMFLKINNQAMDKARNFRLWQAKMFDDPKIIIDCSFDKNLSKKHSCIISRQIINGFADNRKNRLPFNMHCSNVDMNTILMKEANKMMPNLMKSPLEMHTEDVGDLYPRDKLVYLSQHSPNVLTKYNPNDIYIIGALVDKGFEGPITLGRAKELQIRHAWLPLARYISWGCADRGLPLNILIQILLNVKNNGGDWTKAFQHVPARKIKRSKTRQEFKKYSWNANGNMRNGEFSTYERDNSREVEGESELPFAPFEPKNERIIEREDANRDDRQKYSARGANPFKLEKF